jgi:hypothetical protein
MKNQRKSINSKSPGFRLLISILIGTAGLLPAVSLAEYSGGTSNANNQASVVKRDPFWPIGYTPVKVENKAESNQHKILAGTSGATDWSAAMKQVVINGVSSRAGNEYVAVINNEVKVVGESVSVSVGGIQYTWKVDRITPPSSVKLRRLSAE